MSAFYQTFSRKTRLGRLLRFPLALAPTEAALRVLSGPNRGLRWVVKAGPHSCWLGLYEGRAVQAFAAELRPGDTALDIGANAGFFTLAAARRVGPQGRVITFEPQPEARALLERHLALNAFKQVDVRSAALAAHSGVARFSSGVSFTQGVLDEHGDFEVAVTTLNALFDQGVRPRVIKIDVEGSELRVLEGASRMLTEARPTILVETHGEQLWRACGELLADHGYVLEPVMPWPGYEKISGTFLARSRQH